MTKLDTKIVFNQPGVTAASAVIWLHGLGADYNDFVPLVAELKLPMSVKFVFPNAALRPVTINNGLMMRAWYDIAGFSSQLNKIDRPGILASVAIIENLIEDLLAEGFSADKIIIAGFSQGGVISYYSALNSKYQLGGLLVLSGYLPDESLLDRSRIQQNEALPILICHGIDDEVVPLDYAKVALPHLDRLGMAYEWKEYHMAHSVGYEQVQDIALWLQSRLN